jgi:hypothetical protein
LPEKNPPLGPVGITLMTPDGNFTETDRREQARSFALRFRNDTRFLFAVYGETKKKRRYLFKSQGDFRTFLVL